MRYCEEHEIAYEGMRGRDPQPCPVCDAREEIRRHEVENERLRNELGNWTTHVRELEEMVRTLSLRDAQHQADYGAVVTPPRVGARHA